MYLSMAVDRARLAAVAAAALALSQAAPARAATPVAIAPCRIGGIKVVHMMRLTALTAAAKRAFPTATTTTVRAKEIPNWRTEVRDGTDVLMTVESGGRTADTADVVVIDLKSSRFQLAPGLYPGVPLAAAAKVLGPITLADNPTNETEDVSASRLAALLAGWETAHCPINLRVGPGKAGIYPGEESETTRFRPGAKVIAFEIMP